jgi:hypothetical protein
LSAFADLSRQEITRFTVPSFDKVIEAGSEASSQKSRPFILFGVMFRIFFIE